MDKPTRGRMRGNMIECRKCKCLKLENNFTKKKGRQGQYYKKCRECVRVDSKLYRAEVNSDPERKKRMQIKRNKRKKKYQETIKGKYTALKAKAKVRKLLMEISLEDYIKLIEINKCHYCSSDLPKVGFGVDRKDNDLGYIKGNLVACCNLCNTKKGDRLSYEEFCLISTNFRPKVVAT